MTQILLVVDHTLRSKVIRDYYTIKLARDDGGLVLVAMERSGQM